jgi:hypothetical protein
MQSVIYRGVQHRTLAFARRKGTRTVLRQQVMVLYLKTSALDTSVIGWTFYDGTGKARHMAGDSEEPPYRTGLEALQDGWRLIQASPLTSHVTGDEFKTDYLKYEFFFEKMTDTDD